MRVLQDDDIGYIGRERSLEEIQETTFFSPPECRGHKYQNVRLFSGL